MDVLLLLLLFLFTVLLSCTYIYIGELAWIVP
jgi:hypothetical protein